jgi:hypothetical protein
MKHVYEIACFFDDAVGYFLVVCLFVCLFVQRLQLGECVLRLLYTIW